MYYLITGTNGAGKTLNALKWAREMQLKDARPVYYVGFDIKPEIKEQFGWQEFDPAKWEELPDGSICIMDECQKYFPNRPTGGKVPGYVMALTEHRKRGFDFFMITQHPGNIDSFIRKLIGSPSWHRHLKRPFGQNLVSCIEWGYCNASPEKPDSGKDGQISMIPFPKEVYGWYNSAEIHTVKKKIPKKAIVVILAMVAVPLMFYFGFKALPANKDQAQAEPLQVVTATENRPVRPQGTGVMSTAEYIESYKPRIQGMTYTAPRYDEITKPVTAPYPAACLYAPERDACKCYSQQGTAMDVPRITCMSIVDRGYFLDWEPDSNRREGENRDDRG